jgi:hypothetical protein
MKPLKLLATTKRVSRLPWRRISATCWKWRSGVIHPASFRHDPTVPHKGLTVSYSLTRWLSHGNTAV